MKYVRQTYSALGVDVADIRSNAYLIMSMGFP